MNTTACYANLLKVRSIIFPIDEALIVDKLIYETMKPDEFIQHSRENWTAFKAALVAVSKVMFPDVKVFTLPLKDIHGVSVSRYTSDSSDESSAHRLLDRLWWIVCCTDEVTLRQYQQPYFVSYIPAEVVCIAGEPLEDEAVSSQSYRRLSLK